MSDVSTAPSSPTLPAWTRAWLTQAPASPALELLESLQHALEQGPDSAAAAKIDQALAAAELLVSLKVDHDTIAACLAAALPNLATDLDALRSDYGENIANLVERLRRAGTIALISAKGSQVEANAPERLEQLRKMLLAMAEDVRAVLILLAQRVAHMRALTGADEATRRAEAKITFDLYAPLANRLGVWQFKWELEDWAFRYSEPALYKEIASQLDEKRADREAYIAGVLTQLRAELEAAGLRAEVAGRPKHIYSIYKKMRGKGVAFEDLHDVRAVRILVPDERDCYTALGVVHSLWQPIAGEFDDYISHPKGNFYRSLHTAVIGPKSRTVEVQIRTYEMHHDSELGIAAHWRYKEGGTADRKYDQKIAWLRQLLDWKNEIIESGQRKFDAKLFDDTIYALTPQGRIVDLPQGATPIDFAYRVHTDLGHRCRGAKVDGAMVPLNTRLKNAQRVEIVSAKQGGPSRDWLNPELGYLTSARALSKVRAWFRQQQLTVAITEGREALEREMQRAGKTAVSIDKIANGLDFAGAEQLFAAIGHGELTGTQLREAILAVDAPPPAQPVEDITEIIAHETRATRASGGVLVVGVNNIATMIAKCCKPIPPEPIIGFVTRGRGVMVHRSDCKNVVGLDGAKRERLLPADWGSNVGGPFPVDLAIEAMDRPGLLRDISEVMAREHANVTSANTLSRAERARMLFGVEIADLGQLNQLLLGLRGVRGVLSAARRRG